MIRRRPADLERCAGCLEDFLKQGANDRVGTYESVHGTNRTNRAGPAMSVYRGNQKSSAKVQTTRLEEKPTLGKRVITAAFDPILGCRP
jgi:hypothetical protein